MFIAQKLLGPNKQLKQVIQIERRNPNWLEANLTTGRGFQLEATVKQIQVVVGAGLEPAGSLGCESDVISSDPIRSDLVPRAHDPSDLRKGSRALARNNFLSMRRAFVSYSQPIRFARINGKSVNRGLVGRSQNSRSLPQVRRIVGSGDENAMCLCVTLIDTYALAQTTPLNC